MSTPARPRRRGHLLLTVLLSSLTGLVLTGPAVAQASPAARAATAGNAATLSHGGARPDLNGERVKAPGRPEIYLIDRGRRRWIPDPQTYGNLFRDWQGIHESRSYLDIPTSTPISHGAYLAKDDGSPAVYLVDNGHRRWVTSPAAMDKYYFSWDQVRVVPDGTLDGIPAGFPIH
jgi:hypothetical protein